MFCRPKRNEDDFTGKWSESSAASFVLDERSPQSHRVLTAAGARPSRHPSAPDHGFACNVGWVDPPKVCDVYEGQKAGGFDNSKPVANNAGRTDTEG